MNGYKTERFIYLSISIIYMAESLIRPKPTTPIIVGLCGGDNYLISSTHHGLCETPLSAFYPFLNLDEVVAFEAGSFITRKADLGGKFASLVRSHDIYDIFNEVYSFGFPLLNKHKNTAQFSDRQAGQYEEMNPFKTRNLEERLSHVTQSAIRDLKENLVSGVRDYCFEIQYHGLKGARGGDNSNLQIMNFLAKYPPTRRKGEEVYRKQYDTMINSFGSEISRILSIYPREYFPMQNPLPAEKPKGKPEQLTLF
jgi:hypothetical protein